MEEVSETSEKNGSVCLSDRSKRADEHANQIESSVIEPDAFRLSSV